MSIFTSEEIKKILKEGKFSNFICWWNSNVSFIFAKLINDLSIGTTYLIKSLFDQLDTTAGATTSLIPFAQVVTALNRKLFLTMFNWNTTSSGYVLGIILTVVCTVVGIKILIVIVERTAQMLFRLVSAPIIFSLAVFGGDTGPITKWFIEFTGWAMVLPFLGFFFEISFPFIK